MRKQDDNDGCGAAQRRPLGGAVISQKSLASLVIFKSRRRTPKKRADDYGHHHKSLMLGLVNIRVLILEDFALLYFTTRVRSQ